MPILDHPAPPPGRLLSASDTPAALILVEEISHRVLNDYTRAIAQLRLAEETVQDQGARQVLAGLCESMRARAEVYRALRVPEETGLVDLGEHLEIVCAALSQALLEPVGVRLTLVQQNAPLAPDRCWRLGLVVSELITNAARHGLNWSHGEIQVEVIPGEVELCCCVSDSGASAENPTMGRGFRVVRALMEDLGGRAEWLFGTRGVRVALYAPWTS